MANGHDPRRTAFFYGTLMAPEVLHRVCHGNSSKDNPVFATHQLQHRPAILHNHRRQRVKHADYPAVLPREGATVRGTVVTGLTDADIWRLDIFEGDEYRRAKVPVRPLTTVGESDGTGNVEGDEIEAEVYIWKDVEGKHLEDREWDFAEFERDKLQFWTGSAGQEEFQEVDDAVASATAQDGTGGRGVKGHISSALLQEQNRPSR